MAASEPTQHFFESQRLRLAYWSWGDLDAPPLIRAFLAEHGAAASGRRGAQSTP